MTDNKPISAKHLGCLEPLSSLSTTRLEELASLANRACPAVYILIRREFTAHALHGGLQALPDQE